MYPSTTGRFLAATGYVALMVCAVSKITKINVGMLSTAPNIIWLYIAASVRVQDHPHPLAGCAPPPT